jgi:hypothetical protein
MQKATLMKSFTADIRVLGGLPVTIKFYIAPPDPDVGIFNSYIDDWEIIRINDRKCKSANWLIKRIEANKKEVERIEEELMCSIPGPEDRDRDDY